MPYQYFYSLLNISGEQKNRENIKEQTTEFWSWKFFHQAKSETVFAFYCGRASRILFCSVRTWNSLWFLQNQTKPCDKVSTKPSQIVQGINFNTVLNLVQNSVQNQTKLFTMVYRTKPKLVKMGVQNQTKLLYKIRNRTKQNLFITKRRWVTTWKFLKRIQK